MELDKLSPKLLAVVEVFCVAFICIPFLTLGLYALFPEFESWQTESLGFPFPVFGHVVMVAVVLIVILLRRGKLADYGMRFDNPKYHLDIAAACFIPVVLASMPIGLGVDHTTWSGALILALTQIGLLFLLAFILRKKPASPTVGAVTASLMFLSPISNTAQPIAVKAVVVFLTYALFVGFGEEILYRGYIQSRLNRTFGKPFTFFGVAFGWGAVITSLLFGFSHVGVLGYLLGLSTRVTVAWGFWTFFGGLVFGLVREKTGSILAPALLHGLPQAIASVAMLFL